MHKRLLITFLWLTLNFLLTVGITSVLKYYDGRNRPDFFAMCNYKGYRTALAQCENADVWETCIKGLGLYQIQIGKPGKVEDCLDQGMLKQSKSSYPSGHASVSMSGLGFLAYFIYYSFEVSHTKNWKDSASILIQLIVPSVCIGGALMIAGTRPRNYWHNFSDINMGMSIGFASFVICGRMWAAQMTIPNFHNEAGTGTWDAAAGRTCAEENPLAVTKGSEARTTDDEETHIIVNNSPQHQSLPMHSSALQDPQQNSLNRSKSQTTKTPI